MAAYIIANVSIDDPTRYADYTALTPGIIKKYNGEFVVRGAPLRRFEGKKLKEKGWVVLKFEDKKCSAEHFIIQKNIRQLKRLDRSCFSSIFVTRRV